MAKRIPRYVGFSTAELERIDRVATKTHTVSRSEWIRKAALEKADRVLGRPREGQEEGAETQG